LEGLFLDTMHVVSPNLNVRPVSACVNEQGHLVLGGCDTVELARRFGTPLYVMDEATIRQSALACRTGLANYHDARVLYAGKAFLCLAMCRLVQSLDMGLDCVSLGELYTASQAEFPADLIYLHGNNKSKTEIEFALNMGSVKIVADNAAELLMIVDIARALKKKAKVLLRVTPGVEPDTHAHIKTGQSDSKFGFPLDEVPAAVQTALAAKDALELLGLHAHIGSQGLALAPYLEIIDILGDTFVSIKKKFALEMSHLDVGGGLGIAYTEKDQPTPIHEWSASIKSKVLTAFKERSLALPSLMLEPGRSIVGSAGVTLYTAGHTKIVPNNTTYLAVDGGMADNPRPITYQARYSSAVANRMNEPPPDAPLTLVGRYCESGDIIIKEAYLPARSGDLIAIFGTGAYNYSMASNYNRTARPACVLVLNGSADLIIERETNKDLIRNDRVPKRLLE
jgi:diaminopimelate decarboxylase